MHDVSNGDVHVIESDNRNRKPGIALEKLIREASKEISVVAEASGGLKDSNNSQHIKTIVGETVVFS